MSPYKPVVPNKRYSGFVIYVRYLPITSIDNFFWHSFLIYGNITKELFLWNTGEWVEQGSS